MKNTNILEGLQCPQCQFSEQLKIGVHKLVLMGDDGEVEDIGDTEWTEEDYCGCPECGWGGTVSDFREEKEANP